ncbi:MAG TPA: cysteine dioxygenase family protein [Thermoanaerobaculia bacterium]|nr:cysteine dioxygenase family protein [Thermoanaerobaculia bacterium]
MLGFHVRFMTSPLGRVFGELDAWRERIPLSDLTRTLADLQITPEDVQPFVKFDDDGYRRNLMHAGPAYQALVLCWRNGQRSPIHDHRGSNCGVRVLHGTALETVFERAKNRMIYAVRSREMKPGSICATQDDDIHQVSNLAADGGDLVTLHVYSPSLLQMGTYSLFDTEVKPFLEPVYEDALVDGGGI